MTVDLWKRKRAHRGRLMHVVRPIVPPWPDARTYLASVCTTSSLFGGPPHPRIAQPADLWSSQRYAFRRRRGKVIVTTFHDCQECTLAVQE